VTRKRMVNTTLVRVTMLRPGALLEILFSFFTRQQYAYNYTILFF
jgi:hypothetical protein